MQQIQTRKDQADSTSAGDDADGSPGTAVPREQGRFAAQGRHLLSCCCTNIGGGLTAYVLCLYGLVVLAHYSPAVGLPLLAILPPVFLLAICALRHLDGLNGCQLFLTTGCAVLWMSPLLLLQWTLATTHVPTMLYALDSRCATCIDEKGGYESEYASACSCWGKTFVLAFVLSAFPEELLKLVAVLGVANRTHISRPAALVMYAMGASAGFAAVENSLYVLGGQAGGDAGDGATNTAVARAALCIPLHLTCGALTGVGLARWRWLSKRGTESRHLWTLVNRTEESRAAGAAQETSDVISVSSCCACACYGGLPCHAGLAIVVPALLIHTAYDAVLMAPYGIYEDTSGSWSHTGSWSYTQYMYAGSALAIMVGWLGVYILSLPLMAPGVAEQDDTLEPDEGQRVARWPARRREGVNLADCVYASILCCLDDDYYEDEDARLATECAPTH